MFEDFRAAHDAATKAPNYVFDKSRANCWAVVVQMGTTSDVRWSEIEVGDRVRERRMPIVQGVVEAVEETIATVALGAGDVRQFQVDGLEKV